MKSFKELQSILSEAIDNKAVSAELFARCRNAATLAHFAHLTTTSYAAHVALNGFYDGIIPLADSFAEAFMGRYGRFTAFPTVSTPEKDGVGIVKSLRTWIDANRSCCSDSELQNIIDSIVDLCDTTIYKLENLK